MSAKYTFYYSLVALSIVTGHYHHHHHDQHDKNNVHIIDTKSSVITTTELRKISEQLFDELPKNIYQSLIINYQGKKYSNDSKDEATKPLFTVPEHLLETLPTLRLIRKLYDKYDINSRHEENMTPEKNSEENAFIDSLLDTSIMIHVMDFLSNKGYFQKDINVYKQTLKKIWFGVYSRSNNTKLGSSGFEHVFLAEKRKDKHITGLHNWIFFATEEYNNKANYLGYVSKKLLSDKASVLDLHFSYLNKTKFSTMFIGTLPEFDIALYTLCFYARPNKKCSTKLGNEKITIQTWVEYSNNEKFVSSSFPKIYN